MQTKFITIEGIEGVGKTTAVKTIEDYLIQHKQEFIVTREPGGTLVAEQIRKIVLMPQDEKITADAELFLMFACRAQHIENVIKPALKAGKWVVSDRFVDASYAYQGGGRKMDMKKIEMLDQWTVGDCQAQLTILLDAPPEIGLARAKHRGPQDRIEQEKIEFFVRVRDVYLKRAKQFPDRFFVIDATKPLETVERELINQCDEILTSAHHAN